MKGQEGAQVRQALAEIDCTQPPQSGQHPAGLLAAVARILAEAGTLSEAAPRLLRAVCEGMGWPVGVLWLVDTDTGRLRREYAWPPSPSVAATWEGTSPAPQEDRSAGPLGWRVDPTGALEPSHLRAAARPGSLLSWVCPVASGSRLLGVLEFVGRDGLPAEEALAVLAACTGRLGPFIDREGGERGPGAVAPSAALQAAETPTRRLGEPAGPSAWEEALGRLVRGAAHDFNTLVCAIQGYAQLLRARLPPDDPVCEWVDNIDKTGARASALARHLLACCRRQVSRPQSLDLNAVVADVGELFRRLRDDGIDLVIRLAPDLGPIRADPGQVGQVLLNLGVNARDAMPGGGRLTIETSNVEVAVPGPSCAGMQPGPYVLLAVTDTGCGMTEDVRARLFEPFFTTKGEGKGTGLGLATVADLVRRWGGHVTVESEPGRGSTFQVYFPRADPAEAPRG